jgi:hypothetical protein
VAERLYFKLWIGWYTCESHVDLSGDALHIGPVLMSFCIRRWVPGVDLAYAVNEKGAPVSVAAIARRAKWTSKRTADALGELESVGTCVIRSDGAWGFSKFGRWQESASAAKMRKCRQRDGHSDQDVPPIAEVEVGGELQNPSGSPPTPSGGSKKTAPVEAGPALVAPSLDSGRPTANTALTLPANDLPGEESPGLLNACSPAPSKPKRGKPRADYPAGLDEHLLERLREACRSLTPPLRGPHKVTDDMRDALRKLWAACEPTIEDVDHVVAVRCAMTRRGEGWGHLTWDSICVPSNFRRWLAERVDQRRPQSGPAPVSSRPERSGVVDLKSRFANRGNP